jgi:mannitol/fructose-specific phosphotransferase system IIA component (Ntr-type)
MANKNLNLYFTASIAARDKYLENYKKIISHVEKKGHTMIADHILMPTEKEISLKSREDRLA